MVWIDLSPSLFSSLFLGFWIITIYINKKWKNVLINIAVNDNTLSGIDNDDRNYLYSRSNTKITANNFIKQINDLDSKYEFIDYTSYVIIEEDGTFKKYNFII